MLRSLTLPVLYRRSRHFPVYTIAIRSRFVRGGKRYGTGSGSDRAPLKALSLRAPGRYRSRYRTNVVWSDLDTLVVNRRHRIDLRRPTRREVAPRNRYWRQIPEIQSCRRATIGSTREARKVGMKLARQATAANRHADASSVVVSCGARPKSKAPAL